MYTFPNVPPDTYLIRVTMDGFKTLERSGVAVSPGDRVAVPPLVIEVGGLAETVTVAAEAALIQSQTGERSFTVATDSVQNLPISNRSFTSLTALAPGVDTGAGNNNNPGRLGGGGSNNTLMDGVSTVDSPTDQTVVNPQYNPDGSLVATRVRPADAGFGAATNAFALRSMQAQIRFQF